MLLRHMLLRYMLLCYMLQNCKKYFDVAS
jgi:hypothetical protein